METTLDIHNLIVCFQPPILKISLNFEQYWIAIIKSSEKPEDADQHKNRISTILQKWGGAKNYGCPILQLRGGTAGHVKKYHSEGTQKGSSGKMVDREKSQSNHLDGNKDVPY